MGWELGTLPEALQLLTEGSDLGDLRYFNFRNSCYWMRVIDVQDHCGTLPLQHTINSNLNETLLASKS